MQLGRLTRWIEAELLHGAAPEAFEGRQRPRGIPCRGKRSDEVQGGGLPQRFSSDGTLGECDRLGCVAEEERRGRAGLQHVLERAGRLRAWLHGPVFVRVLCERVAHPA